MAKCKFPDLPKIEHASLNEHIIGAKILIGNTFAVFTYFIGVAEHLVNNDFIAHKS